MTNLLKTIIETRRLLRSKKEGVAKQLIRSRLKNLERNQVNFVPVFYHYNLN